MTDEKIIASLLTRDHLPPTPHPVICEFKIGYQKANRCLEAARVKRGPETPKRLTMEDF